MTFNYATHIVSAEMHINIDARIKAARKSADLTQPQLASKLGVDTATVWRWEHGHSFPSGRNLARLHEFFLESTGEAAA